MAYFPAFIKLDDEKILIVGGGNIAYEKLLHLLDFTKKITIVAKVISEDMMMLIKKNDLDFRENIYKNGDIESFKIVIIAVDDISLQKEIYIESKKYNCLCNAVDSVDYCDFIFPSYVKKDDLTIAISTSGASPALAKYLRIYLSRLIPNGISDFLKEMKALRSSLPKGKKRMKILDEKAKKFFNL
ncbi:MAG: bifunctional precorrin-2 dehydrogenase/sirohydrochlorin ferrochelatase [Sulfurospirillum sp.]